MAVEWSNYVSAKAYDFVHSSYVQDRINTGLFGSLSLGGFAQWSPAEGLDKLLFGPNSSPPFYDRPFGLVRQTNVINRGVLNTTVVVLTREIIETALNGQYATSIPVYPNLTISIPKPGILVISFLDGLSLYPSTWVTSRPAAYHMILQVERFSN